MRAKMFFGVIFMAMVLVIYCTEASAIRIMGAINWMYPINPPGTSSSPGQMTGRLARTNGINGTCDAPIPVTSAENVPGTYGYHWWRITPQRSGCVTVWFRGLADDYQVAAYSDFNQQNPKANIIGHGRNSVLNNNEFFSFRVTAGVSYEIVAWSIEEDDPSVHYDIAISESLAAPSDFDGDGFTDSAVFRPSTGAWYILQSSTGTLRVDFYGVNGDIPLDGDFDGDGRSDLATFRPSNGTWYYHRSYNGTDFGAFFGLGTDTPVPGDHDKDGVTDIAAFRPSTGQWFVSPSADNHTTVYGYSFGSPGDIPISSQRK